MEKKRSFAAYRSIDLLLWAAILVVFEGVILRAARSLFFADQPFTVSLAGAVVCIVMMRWGAWSGIHAFLAGAVYCLLGGGTWRQLLVYAGGNLLALAALPVMNRIGREELRKSEYLYLGVSLGTLLLMQAGRALLALLLGAAPAEAVRFFTTDSLSAVFTLVIIWIVRRLDGVYEDQRHYLSRFHQELEKERTEGV